MPAAFTRTTGTARLRRRGIAAAAVVVAGILALSACSSGASSATESTSGVKVKTAAAVKLSGGITWADFGGPTNAARYTAYFNDFTSSTGVKVTSTIESDAIANSMLSGGAGAYDAIHVGLDQVYANKSNIQKLPKSVPLDTTLPADIRAYAFGTFLVGHAQAYLTSTFPNGGPKTWADFWNVKKFPGKRAWPGSPGSYDSTCEVALLADGVKPADLYPLDLKRCDKKMDKLRPYMVFYTSYPQIQTLLTSGTAAIAMGPSGQYAALQNAGQQVTISWDHAVVSPNVITIPKTAPDKANIFALAKLMAQPKRMATFSTLTAYGPGNKKAFNYMTTSAKGKIVNAPSHSTVVYQNSKARAKQTDALLANYTKWLSE